MMSFLLVLMIGAPARDYENEARAALALAAAMRPQEPGKGKVIQYLPPVTGYSPMQRNLSTYQQVGRFCTNGL